ncbi:MAG: electron transport complex subunit RsxC [Spirochaetaceae bacterium]|jgi:electron transport complex protein RnfC|nr:electron transport complex subunit RsxC [Spirochaetaceae bacterium]
MSRRTFKGGVHPPEHKDKTKDLAIESVFPFTKTVVIPVTQGGAPNQPLVKVGDTVARGQKIAASDAFMSVPVHASIAGVVKKIEPRAVTGNIDALCITIVGDDSGTTAFMPPLDPFACSREEALARVRDAGIAGMGGASFPAHVKLSPPKGKTIEYVIANAAECEPYLTIDERTIAEQAEKVIDGLAIAMRIVSAPKGIIVLEDNKASLVPGLREAVSKSGHNNITIEVCKTKYPQGGEKILTLAVLGREIPSGGLPADIGCVIQNVGTLRAVSEAFREGKPLIERGLTLSGGACETPKNISVPIGTLVGDLIPERVTLRPGVAQIISGGPMMGIAMANANFPIQKNTSGVLFLTRAETVLVNESPCIGCGFCMRACSCHLSPVLIMRALNGGNYDEARRCGLMDCIECGSCAYVCPARIKLVQRFRVGKQLSREELRKKQELAEKCAAVQSSATGKGTAEQNSASD